MKYFWVGAVSACVVLVGFVIWKWRNIERFIICGMWGDK